MRTSLLPALSLALALAACGPHAAPATPTPTPEPTAETPAAAGVTLTPYAGLTATERADGVLIVTDDRVRVVPYSSDFGGEVGGFLPTQGRVFRTTPGARAEVWTGYGWQTVAAWR